MSRKGFFTLDGIAALLVLAVLITILGLVAGQRAKMVGRLADTRAAMRLAEKTLLDLQQGLKINPPPEVKVTPLPLVEGDAVPWVRVDVQAGTRTISLTGPTRRMP